MMSNPFFDDNELRRSAVIVDTLRWALVTALQSCDSLASEFPGDDDHSRNALRAYDLLMQFEAFYGESEDLMDYYRMDGIRRHLEDNLKMSLDIQKHDRRVRDE